LLGGAGSAGTAIGTPFGATSLKHVAVLKFPDPQISTEYKHTLPNRDDKTMGPGQRTSCSQAAESLAACGQVADEEAIHTQKKT